MTKYIVARKIFLSTKPFLKITQRISKIGKMMKDHLVK